MTDSGSGIEIYIPRRLSWVTVGGFLIMVAAVVTGYLTLQATVRANSEAIAELAQQLAADRAFHIEQRVRVWDRVNQLEQAIQLQRENNAAINARLQSIEASVNRILDLLESRR